MSSMNRFLSGVIRAPSDWNSYGDNHFQSAGCPAPAATRHSHPTPSASLRHSIPQSGLVHGGELRGNFGGGNFGDGGIWYEVIGLIHPLFVWESSDLSEAGSRKGRSVTACCPLSETRDVQC